MEPKKPDHASETPHESSRAERDDTSDELLESAFPAPPPGGPVEPIRSVFAIIPEAVVQSSPEEFSSYLESVFAAGEELDAAVDHSLTPTAEGGSHARGSLTAVVPTAFLGYSGGDPANFLEQVFEAFDEIDQVLASLSEEAGKPDVPSPVAGIAVVSEEAIADPVELVRAIDRVEGEAVKLELLFRQAKHCLKRLTRYRLSRRSPGSIMTQMRSADDLRTLQYLVDFLRSVHAAADSFERLELPRPHIRDYLEHLYQMEDWDGMAQLVHRLEQAVLRYSRSGQ